MNDLPNIEGLKGLYLSNATARAFLDHCAGRINNQSVTKVDCALGHLRRAGHKISNLLSLVFGFGILRSYLLQHLGILGWPKRRTAFCSAHTLASHDRGRDAYSMERMLHGVGRQDWVSGGLFMFHVLSLLLLLFNVWSVGGRP